MRKIYILICISIYLFAMPKSFAGDISNCNFSNLSKESKTSIFNISEGYYIDLDLTDKHYFKQCLKGKSSTIFHLFSHGKAGQLLIEGNWLSADQIVKWLNTKKLLDDKSQLNIYGCNFAKGEKGKEAVSYLESALGVSIAASDDITGIDGDWILENNSVDMTAVFAGYAYSLQQTLVNETSVVSGSYTVPANTTLEFQIKGGEGGDGTVTTAGQGATATAVFDVTAGDVIRYLVAEGGRGGTEGGGGGSTGIYINSTLVMVAGGGAGGDNSAEAVGLGANSTTNGDTGTGTGPGAGGTTGVGGGANDSGNGGGGGGGINSAGANGAAGANGGGMADPGYALAAGGTGSGAGGAGGRGLTGGGGGIIFYSAGGGGYSGGGASGGGAAGGGSAGGGGSYVNTGHPGYVSSKFNEGANGIGSGGAQANGADGYVIIIEPLDSDDDGVIDSADLDDDNDGILDTDECSQLTPPLLDLNTFTFTDSGSNDEVGDKIVYQNAGNYDGTSFDLELVVISNPSPSNLTIDIDNSDGIFIYLTGGNVGAQPEFQVNFYEAGTNTPIEITFDGTFTDLDGVLGSPEALFLNQSDIEFYQLSSTTSLTDSNPVGEIRIDGSTVDVDPTNQNNWLKVRLLPTASFNFRVLKRSGAPGYNFISSDFTTPATPVVLNNAPFKCLEDTDNDGIVNSLDLDSDNDGCPDFMEGGASFALADGITAGGTLSGGTGSAVTDNLGNTVQDTNLSGADYGVPTIAGTGQFSYKSQDASDATSCLDSDGDGIADLNDLDDDNDGILDTDECNLITPPLLNFDNFTFTDGGSNDEVGDKIVYQNAGSYDGTSFDLELVVISNPSPVNLTIDIDNSDGIFIYLTGGNVGAQPEFQINFYEAGTNTLIDIPFDGTFTDLDGVPGSPEAIFLDESDMEFYQLSATTSLADSNPSGEIRIDGSTADVTPLNQDNWFKVRLLPTASFNFRVLKRSGTPGYNFISSDFTNPATPVALNTAPFKCYDDADNDGIVNSLDLDSDNDGCPDFVEGGGTFVPANGVTAQGTLSDGNGGTVNTNLRNTVDVDNGVPISAGTGQASIGTSQLTLNSTACDIDTDGDGLLDAVDIDSDNDGIPDEVEMATATNGGDSDGDGIADYADLDSDNDGIPDLIEAGGTDTNGDGIVDDACTNLTCDVDGDGLMDSVDAVDDTANANPTIGSAGTLLPVADTDSDGQPDFQDLDADNDGINDITEAGITDTDNNGIVDQVNIYGILTADADSDGFSDSLDPSEGGTAGIATDPDADNDGQPDDDDGDGTAYNADDTDGDGTPDFLDLDSDNDGIHDVIEGGNVAADTDGDGTIDADDTGYADTDNDGIPNSIDQTTNAYGDGDSGTPNSAPTDTDADNVPDYQDLDSDNDSINDVIEGGNSDVEGDGLVDDPTTDTDGDGIPDSVDEAVGFGDAENDPSDDPTDSDNDGTPDSQEIDSDNDFTNDIDDPDNPGGDPTVDGNNDGVVDDATDTDGDGIADVVDENPNFGDSADSDGDGVADINDIDSDNDGIPDDVENLTAGNGGDTDGDGIPDYLDLDSDNDGIPDLIEAGGTDTNGDGILDDACSDSSCDTDGDGLMDSVDAVDDTSNPSPTIGTAGTLLPVADTDGDGRPDFQDLDADNDGINDIEEAGITDADNNGIVDQVNPDGTLSADIDGDGFSDSLDPSEGGTAGIATDPDADNDGQPDDDDGDGTAYNADDTDGDGTPDFLDLDSDNDGIHDVIEGGNVAADTDGDGTIDADDAGYADTDNDGIPDSIDQTPNDFGDGNTGSPNTEPTDSDGDNVPDYQDLDSDNDTINDVIEGGNSDVDGDGQVDDPTTDTDGDGIPDSTDDAVGFGDSENDTSDDPTDSDSDFAPDYREVDSDNDGTNDIEDPDSPGGDPTADSNNDGQVDIPTDTDGDGIADVVDGNPNFGDAADSDGDGVLDINDIDSDNDGIPDDVEIATASNGGDTDGDGIPDYLDLDSDNDGIPDLVEAGGTDTDGDGIVDDACTDSSCDTDGDGLMDSADAVDDTSNANPTTGSAGTTLPITDTDGDGNPDFQDLDSDNDGINDILEAGIPDANNDGIVDLVNPDGTLSNDADGDGYTDSLDPNDNNTPGTGDGSGTPVAPVDTDGDNVPDYQDLDSDNDGINDIVESGNGAADTNNDGIADNPTTDTDGDGIPDSVDNDPTNFGDAGGSAPQDTDSDGIPDNRDLDSDDDGVLDIAESGNDAADTDGNGVADGPDADGDGIPDSLDDNPSTFGDAGDAGTGGYDSDPLDENSGGSGVVPDSGTDADDDGIADSVDYNDAAFGSAPCEGATLEYAITDGTNNTTGYIWDEGGVPAGDVPSNAMFGISRSTSYCESGGWRHYHNANEPDKMLFSIEMGSNTTEIDYIEIRVDENPSSRYDTVATDAMFTLSRDWHVETVGGAALTAPVNVRFYYPPSELKQMLDGAIALADTDPSANAPTAADIVWFKSTNFDPSSDINPDGTTLESSAGYTALTPNVVASPNGNSETDGSDFGGGINYVQFNGITGFSGGTAYVKVSGNSLPVELISFTGTEVDCKVHLNWRTASEENFSHYELERSTDGRNFRMIEIVNGLGNTSFQNSYQFTDDLFNNLNYYRLKMVDLDGSFEYSKVLYIKTACGENSISIYPNPIGKGNGALSVDFHTSKEESQFEIIDMLGRIVKRATFGTIPDIKNRVRLDVSDLPSGTYMIKFDSSRKAHKFIINE